MNKNCKECEYGDDCGNGGTWICIKHKKEVEEDDSCEDFIEYK